jgi:hypothetical protein
VAAQLLANAFVLKGQILEVETFVPDCLHLQLQLGVISRLAPS